MSIRKGNIIVAGNVGGSGGISNVDNQTIITQADGSISTVAVKDQNNTDNVKFWTGTLAEYEALEEYDENTLYNVTDDDESVEGLLEEVKAFEGQLEGLQEELNEVKTKKATTEEIGMVKPDGTTISITEDGIISVKEHDILIANLDKLYEGVNLEEKFADEIATYSDKYAWLKARTDAGNFEGMHVGDYIYVTMSAGSVGTYTVNEQTFKCRIVGINTYKHAFDTEVTKDMLYFISDEVCDTLMYWNPANNNNGTSVQSHPWLASAAYALLNGVNNYTTSAYNNVAHGIDASGKGILQLLPSELQSILIQKRMLLDQRYSASGLLTGSTSWDWQDGGLLWLPNEYEVYGCAVRSNLSQTDSYWHPEAGCTIQFPWFANKIDHRIKRDSAGVRRGWWLSCAASYYSSGACHVSGGGSANGANCSYLYGLPVCFCI